jgi:hypothetical protein
VGVSGLLYTLNHCGKHCIVGLHGLIFATLKVEQARQALEAYTCNPSYSGGRDQEDSSSRTVQANTSQELILKLPNTKQGWQSG